MALSERATDKVKGAMWDKMVSLSMTCCERAKGLKRAKDEFKCDSYATRLTFGGPGTREERSVGRKECNKLSSCVTPRPRGFC